MFHTIRQATVALNVWQPEVIRGKQKQMVEQCDVPVESRISALEMELRLCKQQIASYDKALVSVDSIDLFGELWGNSVKNLIFLSVYLLLQKVEKRKVDRAKEQLESVKYHPLHDFSWKGNRSDEHSIRRKKSKHA